MLMLPPEFAYWRWKLAVGVQIVVSTALYLIVGNGIIAGSAGVWAGATVAAFACAVEWRRDQ